VLAGDPPEEKVIDSKPPDLARLTLLYVETSRGCPFKCEFCLSSLDTRVREFPLAPFFDAMETLLGRGATQFKFLDRTFNLREERVLPILDFFHERLRPGMQVHFEVVPDRLWPRTLERMADFPPGVLRLEIGVQTFNEETLTAISRVQNMEKTLVTLRFLREHTGVLLHADLVLGLPYETWESIREGFDRLVTLRPPEIQVGILKRLKGTRIGRHSGPQKMVYSSVAPYEVLQTATLSFHQVQRLKRFARYFELYYNSGNFPASLELLWSKEGSAFEVFMAFSDYLWGTVGRTHSISLVRLAEHLYRYLIETCGVAQETATEAILADYHRVGGRTEKLAFLRKSS